MSCLPAVTKLYGKATKKTNAAPLCREKCGIANRVVKVSLCALGQYLIRQEYNQLLIDKYLRFAQSVPFHNVFY